MNKETKEAIKIAKNNQETKDTVKLCGILTGIVILAGLAAIK